MLDRQHIRDQLFAKKANEALMQRYVYDSLAAAVLGGIIAAKLFNYSNYGYSTHGSTRTTLVKRGDAKIAFSLTSAIANATIVASYYHYFPITATKKVVVHEAEIDQARDIKTKGRTDSEINLLKDQALIRNGLYLLAWSPFIGYAAARIFHQRALRTELAIVGLRGTELAVEAQYQQVAHRSSVRFGAAMLATGIALFGGKICLDTLLAIKVQKQPITIKDESLRHEI